MRHYPAIAIRFGPAADDSDVADRLVAGLDDFAPAAIEESEGFWRVFFASSDARDRALAWCRTAEPGITVTAEDVPDDDWARRSQANLGPVRIGRIVVTPPWALDQARTIGDAGDALIVVIVPSTGFGTAHHASTRLCLALLQETPLDGLSVLDIGTGSGVLAIAAARLGAASVTAVDNDPDAIDTARENVALNPARAAVACVVEDLRRASRSPVDVVLANLTGELLARSAREIARLTKPGGLCIVSGVLATEEDRVRTALAGVGLVHVKTIAEDEWAGLLLARVEQE